MHMPYITTLIWVMLNWNIEDCPSLFQLVHSRPETITEQQVLDMEHAAACVYTQQFFNHFGRMPIVPHYLH